LGDLEDTTWKCCYGSCWYCLSVNPSVSIVSQSSSGVTYTFSKLYFKALRSKFTNISAVCSHVFCSSMRGWLTAKSEVNLDIHLNNTLRNGLRTTLTLQQLMDGQNRYQTLFSYDMDTCQTLRTLLQGSLMKIWLRNVFKYGNLTERCPIKPVRTASQFVRLPGSKFLPCRPTTISATFSWRPTAFRGIYHRDSTAFTTQITMESPRAGNAVRWPRSYWM